MSHRSILTFCSLLVFVGTLAGFNGTATAQIGGHLASEGSFVLEDAEDMDLHVDSLGRDWIYSWNALTSESLSGTNWVLAEGQSPQGCLKYSIAAQVAFGQWWVEGDFGVPMPAIAGASSADSPGNISDFQSLSFLTLYSTDLANLRFRVILECYPGNPDGTYPKLMWDYTPALGKSFERVEIDLHTPSAIQNNPDSLSVEELLSKTRFLDFYFLGGPYMRITTLEGLIDDITLEAGEVHEPAKADQWILYR